jgi:hypothetical protein
MNLMQIKKLRETCHALKFEGVEVLEKFTDNELRIICNGIGPEFFPEKFRKIITWIFKYLEATAFLHDAEYQAQVGFSLANTHFYNNGMKEVDAKFAWYDPRRYVGRHRVRQFYWILETFGIRAYNEAGRRK